MSQFSSELCKLESSNMVYICRRVIVSWDCDSGSWLLFSIFIHFSTFPILHVNIKNFYVGVFSGTFKARMLKLCIHMDNELLYCGIENRTPCFYSSLYLSKANFVSQFS